LVYKLGVNVTKEHKGGDDDMAQTIMQATALIFFFSFLKN
jgi:hypothetical protein